MLQIGGLLYDCGVQDSRTYGLLEVCMMLCINSHKLEGEEGALIEKK